MFGSSLTRNLRGVDFYRNLPKEYAEGTVSGACISVVSIITLILLTLSAIATYSVPVEMSDLLIDQKHSQDKLKVFIDISFPKFPCAILSLDVENVLKVHSVNVRDQLNKYTLPANHLYDDSRMDPNAIRQTVKRQISNGQGCRLTGNFWVDRVPGNFHISTHGYNEYLGTIIESGVRKFDLSHTIHSLYFGDEKPKNSKEDSLGGYVTQKQIPEDFMGITYTYFLEVIERNTIFSNGYKRQAFYYTARVNEVIINNIPMVYFKYETNPMTELHTGEYQTWKDLMIQLVAIIGGIFTVSSIVDQMVHSSIRFLVEKQRMGKLA